MKVSIIIPVVRVNDYIKESIRHILGLDYGDFEVLVLPDAAGGEFITVTHKVVLLCAERV